MNRFAHVFPKLSIAENRLQRFGERLNIPGLDQAPVDAIADGFRYASDAARHYRFIEGDGGHQHSALIDVTVRKCDQRGGAEQRSDLIFRNKAKMPGKAVIDAQRPASFLKRLDVNARKARNNQSRSFNKATRKPGKCLDQNVEALVSLNASKKQDLLFRDRLLLVPGFFGAVVIESSMRNDVDAVRWDPALLDHFLPAEFGVHNHRAEILVHRAKIQFLQLRNRAMHRGGCVMHGQHHGSYTADLADIPPVDGRHRKPLEVNYIRFPFTQLPRQALHTKYMLGCFGILP